MCLLIEEFFRCICIELPTVRIEETTRPIVRVLLLPLNDTLSAVTVSAVIVCTPVIVATSLPALVPAVCLIFISILALPALILAARLAFIFEMNVPITLKFICKFHRIELIVWIKWVNSLLIC